MPVTFDEPKKDVARRSIALEQTRQTFGLLEAFKGLFQPAKRKARGYGRSPRYVLRSYCLPANPTSRYSTRNRAITYSEFNRVLISIGVDAEVVVESLSLNLDRFDDVQFRQVDSCMVSNDSDFLLLAAV